MDLYKNKRIIIISGHYGVGKSEFASNLAIALSSLDKKVAVIDLDVVNPYFTTRGITDFLNKYNIEVIGPSREATHADLPAIPKEVTAAILDDNINLVIDLGGDAAGSKALGRYNEILSKVGYDLFYLVNVNRPFSEDVEGVLSFLKDIENATRLKVSGIVNSTHLLFETSLADLNRGEEVCIKVSKILSIPYRYLVLPEWILEEYKKSDFKTKAQEVFPLDLTLRPVWLGMDNLD